MLGPTLESDRLLLRPPSLEDFEAYADFAADSDVMTFLGGTQNRSSAWRGLAMVTGAWSLRGFSFFSVIEKQTNQWIGRVGPWYPEGWPGREVGWAIVRSAQRRGYGAEAAAVAVDWVFRELGWADVIHCIDPKNTPSIAVAERLGSAVVRQNVDAPAPMVATWDLYGQTRDAWIARHPPGSLGWKRIA